MNLMLKVFLGTGQLGGPRTLPQQCQQGVLEGGGRFGSKRVASVSRTQGPSIEGEEEGEEALHFCSSPRTQAWQAH